MQTEPTYTADDMTSSSVSGIATTRDYITLLKPRIMMLVAFTGFVGCVLAPTPTPIVYTAIIILAIALGSGGAGALNMWYDADIDAKMTRTSTRPVARGAIPPAEALSFGLILSGLSVLLMWMASNFLAAGLLALSIAYYGGLYTMVLKRRTPQNIVIGGAAGAFPPVIGWAAMTGTAPLDAWLLFAIIFFWTPPHFWALSLLAHKDYAKVGVPMLPVTHGAKATRLQILLYTLILLPFSLAPVMTGLAGAIYAGTASLLGLLFLLQSVQIYRSAAGDEGASAGDSKKAIRLFAFSILYLFLVFAALLVEQAHPILFIPLGVI